MTPDQKIEDLLAPPQDVNELRKQLLSDIPPVELYRLVHQLQQERILPASYTTPNLESPEYFQFANVAVSIAQANATSTQLIKRIWKCKSTALFQ